MMYKAFAVLTLVGAPILVLVVQNLTPHQAEPVAPVVQPVAATVQPVQPVQAPAPAPMPNTPPPDPASFGQPLPDAAKPFLSPGNGLPGGVPAPATPVDSGAGEEGTPGAPGVSN